MLRKKLHWHEIDIGDILKDYNPACQAWVHYLIVDKRSGERYTAGHGIKSISFYILQPLDGENRRDVELSHYDLDREYSTWRKVG